MIRLTAGLDRARSSFAAAIGAAGALAARHERRVWLLWAIGAAVLLATPFALADPATLIFVLDPELLALVVMVGIALARATAEGLAARILAAVTSQASRRSRSH